MSPQDVELIVRRVLESGVSPNGWSYGLVVLLSSLAALCGSFFGTYVSEKAKHVATKEDFNDHSGGADAEVVLVRISRVVTHNTSFCILRSLNVLGFRKTAEALADKQPIDRRIGHLYPTSRSYCSGVSKRSTLPRPVMMACSTACLEARSRNPLPRRIISTILSGFVKVRGGAA
jgi:hypothetical protein